MWHIKNISIKLTFDEYWMEAEDQGKKGRRKEGKEGSVREGGKEGRRRKKEREREEGRKKEILNKDHRA